MSERKLEYRDGSLYHIPDWSEIGHGDEVFMDMRRVPDWRLTDEPYHGHYLDLWYVSLLQQARKRGFRVKSKFVEHGRRMWFFKKTLNEAINPGTRQNSDDEQFEPVHITLEDVAGWDLEVQMLTAEIQKLERRRALFLKRLEVIPYFRDSDTSLISPQ